MAGAVSFVMTSREARRFGDGPVFCRAPRATRRMKAVRRAFSLAEVLIVLAILAALGGSVLSVGAIWGRPTAAKEADRAMRWLYGVVARADLAGRPFDLRVDERAQRLQVRWEKPMDVEQLSARSGCTLQRVGAGGAYVGGADAGADGGAGVRAFMAPDPAGRGRAGRRAVV